MPILARCYRSYASPARTLLCRSSPVAPLICFIPKLTRYLAGLTVHLTPLPLARFYFGIFFSPFTVAISITKRYFTSLFNIRS